MKPTPPSAGQPRKHTRETPEEAAAAAALSALEAAGLAGPNAPKPWQQALGKGEHSVATLNKQSGGTSLRFWPDTKKGKRIAASFSASGKLTGAAILSHWPKLKKPAEIAKMFHLYGPQMCKETGLTVNLKGAAIKVEEKLHWKTCRQSAVPWWPFYVVQVTPLAGKKFKLYIDLAGNVHRALEKQTRDGA